MNFNQIKSEIDSKSNNWINKIADTINSAMAKVRLPLQKIPPILLLCEIMQRPGMSAISLTSAIIARLPEAGIETGPNEDGSENVNNQFVRIICEELIKEIHNNAVIQGVIEPGSIKITGTGANAGGPVEITGVNVNVPEFGGVIR